MGPFLLPKFRRGSGFGGPTPPTTLRVVPPPRTRGGMAAGAAGAGAGQPPPQPFPQGGGCTAGGRGENAVGAAG